MPSSFLLGKPESSILDIATRESNFTTTDTTNTPQLIGELIVVVPELPLGDYYEVELWAYAFLHTAANANCYASYYEGATVKSTNQRAQSSASETHPLIARRIFESDGAEHTYQAGITNATVGTASIGGSSFFPMHLVAKRL